GKRRRDGARLRPSDGEGPRAIERMSGTAAPNDQEAQPQNRGPQPRGERRKRSGWHLAIPPHSVLPCRANRAQVSASMSASISMSRGTARPGADASGSIAAGTIASDGTVREGPDSSRPEERGPARKSRAL